MGTPPLAFQETLAQYQMDQQFAALFLKSFKNESQQKPDVIKYCVPSCRMDKKRGREEEKPGLI